ncbi:MAG: hypothetical protein LBT40_04425 [Deltaproteobacteria bacterium]|nr:hypothetical protein [Deltaproteobacteria bacterium]
MAKVPRDTPLPPAGPAGPPPVGGMPRVLAAGRPAPDPFPAGEAVPQAGESCGRPACPPRKPGSAPRVSRAEWKALSRARRKASPHVPVRSCCVCRARRPKAEMACLIPFMTTPGPPGDLGRRPSRRSRAKAGSPPETPASGSHSVPSSSVFLPDPSAPSGASPVPGLSASGQDSPSSLSGIASVPDPSASGQGSRAPFPRGRGAWVCLREECIANLRRKGAVDKAFRGTRTLASGSMERLLDLAAAPDGGSPGGTALPG